MGKILGAYVMPHPPIIVPEIGKGEEKGAQSTIDACRRIADEIKELSPDIILLITPHGPVFRDAIAVSRVPEIAGDFRKFGCPQLKYNMNISMQLSDDIIRIAEDYEIPVVPITKKSVREYNVDCELDHGALVPLYFIEEKYKEHELVHITYGMLPNLQLYRFGMCIKKAIEDEDFNAVIIASGDLSHRLKDDGPYGYNPLGEKFDKTIIEHLEKGDVMGVFDMDRALVEGAGECGLRSFYIMLGDLDGKDIKGEALSYEGPFGVGYGVLRFNIEDSENRNFLDRLVETRKNKIDTRRQNEDVYVRLARESLEHYIREEEYIEVPKYVDDEMLNEERGVFVSLKKDGELRGCIGTVFPSTENIANEIIRNAVEAGIKDPRFYPVEEEELFDIEYSVDVLTQPIDTKRDELDPKRFGVIVRKGSRAGLLLPDLEGVDTVEEQLSIALKKAGIKEDEDYTIEKFEVIRHR